MKAKKAKVKALEQIRLIDELTQKKFKVKRVEISKDTSIIADSCSSDSKIHFPIVMPPTNDIVIFIIILFVFLSAVVLPIVFRSSEADKIKNQKKLQQELLLRQEMNKPHFEIK